MQNIHLYIANASGALTPQLDKIQSAFSRATATCFELFQIDNIDILCTNESEAVIPEIGMGGFTVDKHLIYFPVDASKELDEDEMYATLCHEFHHAKRYYGPGRGKTLFDNMVCEGLATCFEEEVSKGTAFLPNHLKALSYKLLLEQKVLSHFDDTGYNHYKWFIEDDSNELPRWTGYTIGYHIIHNYITAHNKKASELVLETSDTIRRFLRDTLKGDMSSS